MTEQTEREAFEAWMSDNGMFPKAVERGSDGEYLLMMAATSWAVWQAACAWQREQILATLPGGYSVDPQWLADEIRAQGDR